MNTNLLVTGAAGFIGYHVAREFIHAGYSVFGLDNFDPFYDRAIKEQNLRDLYSFTDREPGDFEFLELSLRDLDSEQFGNREFAGVIHLAAKAGVVPSIADPEGYLEANIWGTFNVLEFCRRRRITKLIFGSSSSVYGNDSPVPFSEDLTATSPISPYAATKRSCELLCHSYVHLNDFSVACLRFFSVYGPRQRPDLAIHKFTRLISADQAIPLYGDGKSERDYTYISDIVAGVACAWEWIQIVPPKTFDIFNLGGSATSPLIELVKLIETKLGKQAVIDWQESQPGDMRRTHADISKSAKILGYSPKVPIQEGISKFVDWFVNHA